MIVQVLNKTAELVLRSESVCNTKFEGEGVTNILKTLYDACDTAATRILREYITKRKLAEKVASLNSRGGAHGIDARELDIFLDELAMLTQHCER